MKDAKTCWRRIFRENEALNSSWCDRQDEFESAVEEKIATDEQRNISDFNYLCSFKDTLIPGDSGSPLTLKEVDGKWYLIAISVATLNYKWQSNLCDSNTINVKVDFFQTVVPDLAWILEIIHEM